MTVRSAERPAPNASASASASASAPANGATADRQQSLVSQALHALEQQILSGLISGGSKLNEVDLARSLGMSRGPVREAFQALDQAGLVRLEKNRGVFVRQISLEEAGDIYEVRASLEGLIGRLAARRIDAGQTLQLRALVDRMAAHDEASDVQAYFALNLAFHDLLARMSRNEALVANYRRIIKELDLFRRQMLQIDSENIPLSTVEHSAIVDAIAARDEERAAQLMTAHSLDSCRRLHVALAKNKHQDKETVHAP